MPIENEYVFYDFINNIVLIVGVFLKKWYDLSDNRYIYLGVLDD